MRRLFHTRRNTKTEPEALSGKARGPRRCPGTKKLRPKAEYQANNR
uniref:Uncharacterized protein n=1 Tax=Siphoviridae sp. ctBLh2 TaxID=2827803 RepID=A0A8S5S3B1_9CAUD|nr:MAG TPA: hypothetical protein [Siphoviridae sp. ctBLh2]